MSILQVNNLKMYYETRIGFVRAVDDVTVNLQKGRSLGLAGESGCGKTSLALAILRLLPYNALVHSGEIFLENQNLLELDDDEFRERIRWKRISMIFQGAMNALHPFKKIGDQIAEPIRIHDGRRKKDAMEKAGELLDLVGVGAERIGRYPHELSGGMKQRAVIAMALACDPTIVIADEPTTALDVVIQAQILGVLKELQNKLSLATILISHDLSLISEMCDDVAIMYAGKLVEFGDAVSVFLKATHPYTQKLMAAFPDISKKRKKEIVSILGFPPDLHYPPPGCRFHPRCPYAMEACRRKEPPLIKVEKDHQTACHLTGL